MKRIFDNQGAVSKALVISIAGFVVLGLIIIFREQICEFFGWVYKSLLSIFGMSPKEFSDGAKDLFDPQMEV